MATSFSKSQAWEGRHWADHKFCKSEQSGPIQQLLFREGPSPLQLQDTGHHTDTCAVLPRGSDKSLLDFHTSEATFQFFCKELTDLIIATGCPSARKNWCAQGNCYHFLRSAGYRECRLLPPRGGGRIARGYQGRWYWSLFWKFSNLLFLKTGLERKTTKIHSIQSLGRM